MPDETADMKAKLDRVAEDVAGIKALLQSEPQRCAYREQIARAMNSIEERKALTLRVERVEDHLTDARINIARMLATGGAGGVLGTVLLELVKALAQHF